MNFEALELAPAAGAAPCTGAAPRSRWHMIAEIDLARMLVRHSEQRQLCDALEAIADELPLLPDKQDAAMLAGRLRTFAQIAQQEESVFPRLGLDEAAEAGSLASTLEYWRLLDALHAQDLAEMLVAPRSEDEGGGDRIAYMLRCFFEGCRRTIALHETAILLLAGPRLTKAAASCLWASLSRA